MQRCFFIFCTKCRKDHNDGKRKKRMRKTLKRNLSYDDRNHLSCVSLYCDGENGRRVRRTRTYPTMEQAEQVIAEYRRAQLLGGMSAPRNVFVEDWLRCSNDCIATGKGGGSRTLNITPRATSPSTRRESLISRTFCANALRSSSPRRASRRSRSTGCATALRASPTDRMCRGTLFLLLCHTNLFYLLFCQRQCKMTKRIRIVKPRREIQDGTVYRYTKRYNN